MTAKTTLRMGFLACVSLLAVGCAQVNEPDPEANKPAVTVTGIAVLPVRPAVEHGDAALPTEVKTLRDGSQVMDGLLKQLFAGKSEVRFAAAAPGKGSAEGAPAGRLEEVRKIASKYGSNAVLEISLSRYSERVGGDLGVKQPAAVTFAYKLYEVGEGRVLCHGRFDEQQQSLMENLFNLSKTKERGLAWLTAEELAHAGLQERLGECPYLPLK